METEKDIAESPTAEPERPKRKTKDKRLKTKGFIKSLRHQVEMSFLCRLKKHKVASMFLARLFQFLILNS